MTCNKSYMIFQIWKSLFSLGNVFFWLLFKRELVNDVKSEHVTRIMSTSMEMPGKTALHLVYFS
jgi:hypothetical protein